MPRCTNHKVNLEAFVHVMHTEKAIKVLSSQVHIRALVVDPNPIDLNPKSQIIIVLFIRFDSKIY